MINYRLLFIVSALILGCAFLGNRRLTIDTDVVRLLPTSERFIADGLEIFKQHPIHDQIAVDIQLDRDEPDTLVECGTLLEQQMKDSKLFAQVGTAAMGELIPRLALHATKNLPLLFTREELQKLTPLLEPSRITERLGKFYEELGSLDGVGQAEFIGADPLGLKNQVLAKMALLAPSLNTKFYRGSLLSGDGRHLLVTGRPFAAGTNTASAYSLSEFFLQTTQEIVKKFASKGVQVTLTPVGAYRAALDNEQIIRHDVQFALKLSTAGIALLLFLSFSRPLIGLLSLLPSFAGTAAALLVYSLFHSSISVMVLGFGGALISITVDYGIAYLLFLDQSHETSGKEAAYEVRVVGFMAVATTVAAFLVLRFSGFPIFTELGVFSAMGVLFSFLFVNTIFPKIFSLMPAGKGHTLPLQRFVNLLYRTGKPGAIAAVLLACGLVFFASPQFHVSLDSMNTVSQATRAADTLFTKVWGKIGNRIFVMSAEATIAAIQQGNDLTLARIEEDVRKDTLAAAFVPSMIFPGRERAAQNLAAWQEFWDTTRVAQLKGALGSAGDKFGFAPEAFASFFSLLEPGFVAQSLDIPKEYYGLLGISENTGKSGLIQFVTVTPGKNYDGTDFLTRYGVVSKIFDPTFFAERMAKLLFSTFTTMLVIIAVTVALLLLITYCNLPLTLLTLLPSLFAYICTMGTIKLLGQPLDIPALMLLSIAILGMGIDYPIFCVRAHQRYRNSAHPSYSQIRSSVFLSATSTLIAFSVLCFAKHSLLHSIGIVSLLGIGYSLLGTFLLLPPLLERYFSAKVKEDSRTTRDIFQRVRDRYRTVEAYPRMLARFRLRLDPMFAELPRMLLLREDIKTIVDIGCGYGITACWCLETLKEARIIAIESDPEKERIARLTLGERGIVAQASLLDMTPLPVETADVVLLLDMLQEVDDGAAKAVLNKCFHSLGHGGIVLTRFSTRLAGKASCYRWLSQILKKVSGQKAWYRSSENMAELLTAAGFSIMIDEVSDANPEVGWMVGLVKKDRMTEGVNP